MPQKTIGWVAKKAEVAVQTVLYYERRGLLPVPARSLCGYRLFDAASVQRIQFIKRAKELGFSLQQIADLLALQEEQDSSCADISVLAASHLADIEQRLADLERMRAALRQLVAACPRRGPLATCPILGSLGGEA